MWGTGELLLNSSFVSHSPADSKLYARSVEEEKISAFPCPWLEPDTSVIQMTPEFMCSYVKCLNRLEACVIVHWQTDG